MTTSTEIANLALSYIGTRSTIASLTEGSAEAVAVSTHYNIARRALLRAAYWNFSRKQVVAALLKDATVGDVVPQPWLYEYAIPSDAVMMRYILPQYQVDATTPGVPGTPYYMAPPVRFLVSSDLDPSNNQISVVLTNQPSAQFIYSADVTNESLFDSDFVDAFSHLLAAKIVISLTGDKEMAKQEFALAKAITDTALVRNNNESLTVVDSVPDWMRVRGYTTDWAYPYGGYFYFAPQTLSMVS